VDIGYISEIGDHIALFAFEQLPRLAYLGTACLAVPDMGIGEKTHPHDRRFHRS